MAIARDASFFFPNASYSLLAPFSSTHIMGSELGVRPDSKPEPIYSPVSIWWATWAGVWTLAVASGMAYLISRRNMPILRMRGLSLSLSAVVLLHLYYVPVQFGTMIGPILPGDAQFWIMGTFLPCGIALFHASNSRFLHVAKLQRKYVYNDSRLIEIPPNRKKGGLLGRFQRLEYDTRILILVGIGMIAQVGRSPPILYDATNRGF